MNRYAQLVMMIFAIIAVVAALFFWKKQERVKALERLETYYETEISDLDGELIVSSSSERLVDLVEFGSLLAMVPGDPTVLDFTGAPNLTHFAGIEQVPDVQSLVAIDCPKLETLSDVKGLSNLREIVVIDSANLIEVGDLSGLPLLSILDLSGSRKLQNLDLSTAGELVNLYLSQCRSLNALNLSATSKLKQLAVDGCAKLASVEGLEGLQDLTDLDLSNAVSLEQVDGLSGLTSLIVLDIRNVGFESFEEVGKITSLEVLRLGGHDDLETLAPFSGLENLIEIHLDACANFRSINGIPPSVSRYAAFNFCPMLTSLDGIEGAADLEQLDVKGCESLTDISAIASLAKLSQLSLVQCRGISEVEELNDLDNLVVVMLGGSGVLPESVSDLVATKRNTIFDFSIAE